MWNLRDIYDSRKVVIKNKGVHGRYRRNLFDAWVINRESKNLSLSFFDSLDRDSAVHY